MVRYGRIAIILLIIPVLFCPFLLFSLTEPVYGAPDTLDLQLDDPAIIRWDIIDIMPGDSGIEPINLYNAGDIPGYIYIWFGDIVDGEGLNPESETGDTSEPGELSSYILLDIINTGMNFGKLTGTGYMEYYDLPVSIASFPGSSNQALYILSTTINPGETLELRWQWQFPASVGNQAQGDTVSFTFNYMLSSIESVPAYFPPEPPTSPPPTVPPSQPPTTPDTTTPAVEPPVPPRLYEAEDSITIDKPDVRYVVLIEPETTTPVTPDTEDTSTKAIIAQMSLGVAVAGTAAMTTMATIERIRRRRRLKSGN